MSMRSAPHAGVSHRILGRSIDVSKTQDVHAAVEAELRFDALLDATDIAVKNAGEEVALNGTVRSYRQYLKAAGAARRGGWREAGAQSPRGASA
jgi:hypothetical protein